ncbi:hypothetical protein [Enhygromyxa salina]|uniref:Uncharacterized protein n=1 Tax=Enhygromyxa salina TaxID=215803 RepID=A0A2S9YWP6_9BACT|nr:hypothetical protein [Enhygromyxa salina]PRQ09504.1 hypothetical protein ENSA7_07460 [Enhygromyxa salina]
MDERTHDLERAVDALRAKRSPPAGKQAQVLALLEARLGGGPGGGGAEGGGFGDGGLGAVSNSSGVFAAKVVAATAAMTAGGLLVLKLGALTLASLTPDAAAAVEPVAQTELLGEPRVAAPDTELGHEHSTSEPGPESGESATDPPELASHSMLPKHGSKPAAASMDQVDPDPLAVDIAAELRLLGAARAATSPSAVIVELAEHARQFPRGTLSDERDALWAIASCAREDLDDASTRAHAVATRRPNSPLLERISAACPALADTF